MEITIRKKPARNAARTSYNSLLRRLKTKSYENVKLCLEWQTFEGFYEWFKIQYDNGWWQNGWHLDKDIISRGKGIYGPQYCGYVPPYINLMFVKAFDKFTNYCAARGVQRITYFSDGGYYSVFKASFQAEGMEYFVGEFDNELEAFFCCKFAKEEFIQKKANELKDQLNPKMYQALMDYKVMPR